MSQKVKLKNMKLSSYQPVKSIIDSILLGVSKAISIRTTAESTLLEIVEDAMLTSEDSIEDKRRDALEKEMITNELRRDCRIIKYRMNPSLSVTNPISGIVYEVLLRQIDRRKVERVGYDVTLINPGTTKHAYATLRSLMPDIQRSTSIRIWYKNQHDECVVVSADNRSAKQLIHTKLFMTKIWGHNTTTIPEEDEPEEGIESIVD